MTVVGTRPEVIRLSRVLTRLREVSDHILVHTGQHYDRELNGLLFEQLGLAAPDIALDTAGQSAAQSMARVIEQTDTVLAAERPDALLVLGDTTSCLAALPAQRRGIPTFHMEAGNRCFDRRVPEELNRRIVDHVSDVNLCYSEQSRQNLLREGIAPDLILKTGSPLKEVLTHYRPQIEGSTIVKQLGFEPGGYFLASLHRQELVASPAALTSVMTGLEQLADEHDLPILFPVHPRTRQQLSEHGLANHPRLRLTPPMGFFDYVALQQRARCVLSDSGSISEEAAILGFPAVTVRETHERAEAMDEATVLLTGFRADRMRAAVALTLEQFRNFGPMRLPPDYDTAAVSWKVAKIILSYTEYASRKSFRTNP